MCSLKSSENLKFINFLVCTYKSHKTSGANKLPIFQLFLDKNLTGNSTICFLTKKIAKVFLLKAILFGLGIVSNIVGCPGVDFIKPKCLFFYWRENTNNIVLALKTPLLWQQIFGNMLPIWMCFFAHFSI